MEICLENEEDNMQINYLAYNFIKLKYCEKISDICKNPNNNNTKSNCHLNWQGGPFNSRESTKPLINTKNKTNRPEIDFEFIANRGNSN